MMQIVRTEPTYSIDELLEKIRSVSNDTFEEVKGLIETEKHLYTQEEQEKISVTLAEILLSFFLKINEARALFPEKNIPTIAEIIQQAEL